MIIWKYILLSFVLALNCNANDFNYEGSLYGDGEYELNIDFKLPLEISLSSIFNSYLYNSDYLKSISHNDEFVAIEITDKNGHPQVENITNGHHYLQVKTTGQKKPIDISIQRTIVQGCSLNLQEGEFFELQCQADLSSKHQEDTSDFFKKFEYLFSCYKDQDSYNCSIRSEGVMKELSFLFYTFKTSDEAAIAGLCRYLIQFYLLYTGLNNINRQKNTFYKKQIAPVRVFLRDQLEDRKLSSSLFISSESNIK